MTRPDAPDLPDKPQEDAAHGAPADRSGAVSSGTQAGSPEPAEPAGPGDPAGGPGGPGGPDGPAQPGRRLTVVGTATPALALVAGLVAGFLLLPAAPGWLAPYLPVAVVAALDALVGGLRAALERVFDDRVFVASFLMNTAVAVLLVLLGDRLGVGGALTTAVVIMFGIRIFTNATALRRRLFGV